MKTVLQHSLKAILGILLLQFSSAVLAFTIIELPAEDLTPSSSIADSMTLNTQIQPVTAAIKAHLHDTRRKKKAALTAQHNDILAANSYVNSISDLDYLAVSFHGDDGDSSGGQSLWINSTFTSLENDFSRTSFNGNTHLLLVGFDYTLSEKYIFGIAFGYESSNISTRFNSGNEEVVGLSISPYFAFLLSDAWSFDLSIGHGEFDTDQFRSVAIAFPGPVLIVDSDFSSTRDFISMNITGTSSSGNWYLTGSFGFLVAKKKQDGFVESSGDVVVGLDIDIEQWNLAGEAAYSYQDSESYVGLIYEKDVDLNEIRFLTGAQPANDDDSFLLTAGWRYYGKDLTANIELSSRLGQDEFSDNSISTTLRIDL